MDDEPSRILHFSKNPLSSGETLVKSLTCNNLILYSPDLNLDTALIREPLASSPPHQKGKDPGLHLALLVVECVPSHIPWLLIGLTWMGLNAYFPQLFPVYYLWSLFREAILVVHWMVSWWFDPPGWEPNLAILFPLSHKSSGKITTIKSAANWNNTDNILSATEAKALRNKYLKWEIEKF
ncbi:hypothetical protein DSO57_1012850 [Entomophthora muscae]|uniref:Uncharacterized protein n=1 Tax=Entomophthora muscae TaxID=34485 RepID=A0ACC2RX00_9FUNG|nr:hypothetical protein DSO57_1012850 [Entomophthora muscae]